MVHTPRVPATMTSARVRATALLLMLCWQATTARAQEVVPALVDRDLTVAAGASLVNAAGVLVEQLERQVVPDRLFAERGLPRRAINISYRTAKLFLFDRPQEDWLMVANHEMSVDRKP